MMIEKNKKNKVHLIILNIDGNQCIVHNEL